ncbi:orotate phosphoribosyltransferase [Neisseria sp. Ec49-e6-T10]|uniref:orotate phosphoribosyltransferase n=1 Tax=Neisseria sp. Ec49-e6-T10 TaxID=3140744 RepID=UPI003EBA392C
MSDFRQDFLLFAHQKEALKFGSFTTKAGRQSPYFFNAGLFNDGNSLTTLANFYAQAIIESKIEFDMLFGPAYKGITLAAATCMALAQKGVNVPFAFNRKEAKDHGEGGVLIGAPLHGKVLIIDDVISAGTSVRESIDILNQNKAQPAGVVIALDRMEKGKDCDLSAIQQVEQTFNIPVVSIANLNDLIHLMQQDNNFSDYFEKMVDYRSEYGVQQ